MAVPVTVRLDDYETTVEVEEGTTLRRALLDVGVDVYGSVSKATNCGGRGLCGTCGVRVLEGGPPPEQWHDALAERWGYPRLSCQMTVEEPMTVAVPRKVVWGQLLPR